MTATISGLTILSSSGEVLASKSYASFPQDFEKVLHKKTKGSKGEAEVLEFQGHNVCYRTESDVKVRASTQRVLRADSLRPVALCRLMILSPFTAIIIIWHIIPPYTNNRSTHLCFVPCSLCFPTDSHPLLPFVVRTRPFNRAPAMRRVPINRVGARDRLRSRLPLHVSHSPAQWQLEQNLYP